MFSSFYRIPAVVLLRLAKFMKVSLNSHCHNFHLAPEQLPCQFLQKKENPKVIFIFNFQFSFRFLLLFLAIYSLLSITVNCRAICYFGREREKRKERKFVLKIAIILYKHPHKLNEKWKTRSIGWLVVRSVGWPFDRYPFIYEIGQSGCCYSPMLLFRLIAGDVAWLLPRRAAACIVSRTWNPNYHQHQA